MTELHYSHPEAVVDSGQPSKDTWRKEVHSRVARFRTRRGRRIEGAFSMRFPFPPTESVAATCTASHEPSLAPSDVAVKGIEDTTAIQSEPEIYLIDVAAD